MTYVADLKVIENVSERAERLCIGSLKRLHLSNRSTLMAFVQQMIPSLIGCDLNLSLTKSSTTTGAYWIFIQIFSKSCKRDRRNSILGSAPSVICYTMQPSNGKMPSLNMVVTTPRQNTRLSRNDGRILGSLRFWR